METLTCDPCLSGHRHPIKCRTGRSGCPCNVCADSRVGGRTKRSDFKLNRSMVKASPTAEKITAPVVQLPTPPPKPKVEKPTRKPRAPKAPKVEVKKQDVPTDVLAVLTKLTERLPKPPDRPTRAISLQIDAEVANEAELASLINQLTTHAAEFPGVKLVYGGNWENL